MAMTVHQLIARATALSQGLIAQDTSDFAEANHREMRTTMAAMVVPNSLVARASKALTIMAHWTGMEPPASVQRELLDLGKPAMDLAERALPSYRRVQRTAEIARLQTFHKQPDLLGLLTPAEAAAVAAGGNGDDAAKQAAAAVRERIGPDAYLRVREALREHQTAQDRIAELEAENAADLTPEEAAAKQAEQWRVSLAAEVGQHQEQARKLAEAERIRKQRAQEEAVLREAEAAHKAVGDKGRAARDLADALAEGGR